MTKIFATGVTGYIGGDALYAIAAAHPEYDITCLVRNSDKGALVAKEYASFKLVYGDLDSVQLIEDESKKADIVFNFASADHEPAVRAMLAGVSAHDPSHPGFYIHTSGTGILLWDDISQEVFGEASDKIYDDLEGVAKVTSFPDDAPHRKTDKMVLATGAEHPDRTRVAIVCPPTIYGIGRGPDNKRSHQLPELARVTLQQGYGVQVGAGKTLWSNVHVHDLSDVYVRLVENAAAGESLAEWPGKAALWGSGAYYFTENGEHVWGDVAKQVAKEANTLGFIGSDEVKSLTPEEAGKLATYGQALWGANSRSRAKRAREVLGWKPTGKPLEEEIRASVEFEARKLGVKPGHAKVAAGDA